MTKECAAREAIQDFNDLKDLLGDITSGNPNLQREKGLYTYTEQLALDGLTKVQITSRGHKGLVGRGSIRALHVGSREDETQPWQKASLNLGQTVNIGGWHYHQLILPSRNSEPRLAIHVAEIEHIPGRIEEMFVAGISLFCR